MRDIISRAKYRHPGSWPKSQSSPGGNATKHHWRNKMPKTGRAGEEYREQHERSMAGMRVLMVDGATGKRHWVGKGDLTVLSRKER